MCLLLMKINNYSSNSVSEKLKFHQQSFFPALDCKIYYLTTETLGQ